MSIILKGIDLAEFGEKRRIEIYDNGDVVVKEERWDENGYKHYRTLYDIQAIQIPKDHGRLIDADEMQDKAYKRYFNNTISSYGMFEVNRAIENAPTILEAGADE